MAKRTTPRTNADDAATAAPPPKPRRAKATAGAPPSDTVGVQSTDDRWSPSEDEIRHRAYQRYLERGGGDGMDFEDWLHAEQELKSAKGSKSDV
jgi:hypothetical protein